MLSRKFIQSSYRFYMGWGLCLVWKLSSYIKKGARARVSERSAAKECATVCNRLYTLNSVKFLKSDWEQISRMESNSKLERLGGKEASLPLILTNRLEDLDDALEATWPCLGGNVILELDEMGSLYLSFRPSKKVRRKGFLTRLWCAPW